MQHSLLLFYLAKPQSGHILGTYVIVRQNHSIPNVLSKLTERTKRTHSALRGHAAVIVPSPRADHDRVG